MVQEASKVNKTHGTGEFYPGDFRHFGENIVFEHGVMVLHPENIEIEDKVYIGHYTMLHGYYKNLMTIGHDTWIGPQCLLHSAGGLHIGHTVGIATKSTILTSKHLIDGRLPLRYSPVDFSEVVLEDECYIGVGAIILPGTRVGKGAIVGAGAVVTNMVPSYEIWGGVPARRIGVR